MLIWAFGISLVVSQSRSLPICIALPVLLFAWRIAVVQRHLRQSETPESALEQSTL